MQRHLKKFVRVREPKREKEGEEENPSVARESPSRKNQRGNRHDFYNGKQKNLKTHLTINIK